MVKVGNKRKREKTMDRRDAIKAMLGAFALPAAGLAQQKKVAADELQLSIKDAQRLALECAALNFPDGGISHLESNTPMGRAAFAEASQAVARATEDPPKGLGLNVPFDKVLVLVNDNSSRSGAFRVGSAGVIVLSRESTQQEGEMNRIMTHEMAHLLLKHGTNELADYHPAIYTGMGQDPMRTIGEADSPEKKSQVRSFQQRNAVVLDQIDPVVEKAKAGLYRQERQGKGLAYYEAQAEMLSTQLSCNRERTEERYNAIVERGNPHPLIIEVQQKMREMEPDYPLKPYCEMPAVKSRTPKSPGNF